MIIYFIGLVIEYVIRFSFLELLNDINCTITVVCKIKHFLLTLTLTRQSKVIMLLM